MANDTPQDLQQVLIRLGEMSKELAFLKSELARKDKIIAGLKQRLFGSSSEKLDPTQLQLLFDEIVLGKPTPPPAADGETSAPEEGKSNAPRKRRGKADRFPKNVKIVIEDVVIPESAPTRTSGRKSAKSTMTNWMSEADPEIRASG